MDAAHVHLMLNHFPLIGMVFAIPLLLGAWIRSSEDLSRAGLIIVAVTGVLAVATLLTGDPAERVIEHLPGISKRVIKIHEEAAEKSIWVVVATAVAAIAGLVFGWKQKRTPRLVVLLVTVLSVASLAALAWTNNLGGQISHAELRNSTGVAAPIGTEPSANHD
jgi:uncharacterized membrane protein